MRTLFIDQTAQLGGAELCLREIVLERNNRNDCVLLFQDGPFVQLLKDDEIEVAVEPLSRNSASIQKGSGILRKIGAMFDIIRLGNRVNHHAAQFDVIYANTAKALVVAWMAIRCHGRFGLLNNARRRSLIFHLHDILSAQHFSWSNRKLLVFLANRADYVVANSQATLDAYTSTGGNCPNKVIVYNGIDSQPFDDAIANSLSHRAKYRDPLCIGDAPVVGMFGRIAPWKGQHLAIDAIRDFPDAHLFLVGDALFGEQDYLQKLRQQVHASKLSEQVHFLGFCNDVPGAMQACDVILHCSTAPEPFGRVIVEGMLSRRAVIAANAGGAAEILNDPDLGLTFEPNSHSGIVECLRQQLALQSHKEANRDEQARLLRAQQNAKRRFDISARADDVSRVISKCASSLPGVLPTATVQESATANANQETTTH